MTTSRDRWGSTRGVERVASAATGATAAPIRVLHVDADPAFLDTTAQSLERLGDDLLVDTETDPHRVVQRLEDQTIDCVLADYELSGLDGLELLEAVRERHPMLPFVLFTGEGSEELASDAISAGVTDYIRKESGSNQYRVLATRIEQAVDHRRPVDLGADWFATIDFPLQTVTDEHGNVVLLVPEGRDITTLKERERQLQRQNDRLEEFASVVSHDLRTPLTIVQGNLDLARKAGDDEYFDRAERGLERVEDLLEDLLTLAREGQHVSETEPVSLELVSKKAWDMTAPLDATLEVTDATIEADESRLRELLENLFSNAIEHVGTDVRVEVGSLERGGFYVADDGPGIDESDRSKVFESGYSTGENGTGFGLSIVKSIADAHGWEMTLTRSDSRGARFEVTF